MLRNKEDIPALTGARCVAAYSVVFAHGGIVAFTPPESAITHLILFAAYFGMSLFFTLSGYVIYLNYAQAFHSRPFGIAVAEFAWARFARIYPLFIFFVGITFATIQFQRIPALWPEMGWFFSLLQSWVPSGGNTTSTNGILVFAFSDLAHTWSISTEMFFYVCFPFLCLTILRKPYSPLSAIYSFIFFVPAAVAILFALDVTDAGPFMAPTLTPAMAKFWFAYLSPYTRVFEFATGALAARVFLTMRYHPISAAENKWAQIGGVAVLVGLVLVGGVAGKQVHALSEELTTFGGFIQQNYLRAPLIAVLLFFVSRYKSPLQRALSCRAMLIGGTISYSVYMIHLFIVSRFAVGRALPFSALSLLEWFARFGLYAAVSTMLAYGLYHLVEMPMRSMLRRLPGKVRAAFATAQTT